MSPDAYTVVIKTESTQRPVHPERVEPTERSIWFTCSSGDRFGGRWRGHPLEGLLAGDTLPAETTHLVLRSADGFQVCVPLADALEGMLATDFDGDPCTGAPRFVAPGLEGARTIKRVSVIEPISLQPGDAPESFENIVEMMTQSG